MIIKRELLNKVFIKNKNHLIHSFIGIRSFKNIAGTVPLYKRHAIVIDENISPDNWSKRIEQSDHILSSYTKALEEIEDLKTSPLKLTTAIPYFRTLDAPETFLKTKFHDLIIFPEQLYIENIQDKHVSNIAKVLNDMNLSSDDLYAEFMRLDLEPKQLPKDQHHLFVCAHGSRDYRCGCTGPVILELLSEQMKKNKDISIRLWSSSHYGGHRYAGNCIVYPSGDWFGYINTQDDTKNLVQTLKDNSLLELIPNWRGRIGLTKDQQVNCWNEMHDKGLQQ